MSSRFHEALAGKRKYFESGWNNRSPGFKQKHLQQIRDALHNEFLPKGDAQSSVQFITKAALERVWARDLLKQHLSKHPGLKPYLKIISILVRINWTEWGNFKHLFVSKNRTDEKLPFEDSELRDPAFLFQSGRLFFSEQYAFIPVVLQREAGISEPRQYCPNQRLPFTRDVHCFREGPISVTKKIVAAGHLDVREVCPLRIL